MNTKRRFSPLFYNRVSYFGVFLALLVFLLEIFLFAMDFLAHGPNLYLGILTYCLLPPFLILGLLLIPIGALWKKRRIEKGLTTLEVKPLRIDPSLPAHRNAIFIFITGTFILVIMSLVGVYKGFQYTESVEFCGVLCHGIMNPEYAVYKKSPHSKVDCVACHVGNGAGSYVRSKMTGARQVYKALTRTNECPIKTPVKNLRPAQDTCMQCHWPGKFFSSMDMSHTYFLSEGEDPEWHVRMLLNVGGGGHQTSGVHAHMNLESDIFYAAEDEGRQKITWVKSVGKDGKENIFTSPTSKWKDSAPPPEAVRKMDCIDCHNRPTHQFLPPYRLVNGAMQDGTIDRAIPKIKEKAMDALAKEYKDTPEAVASIEKDLRGYYHTKQADYDAAHPGSVDAAVRAVQDLYKANMFPEMKVRWDTHPDNIGHLIFPGCFRCHDGEHRSSEGRTITQDCKACHLIVEQGPAGKPEKNIEGLEFRHPADIGEDWKGMSCTDCHNGST